MPFGVLNIGEAMIMVFYICIGFLGYMRYGKDTDGSITSSLPNEPLYEAVQLSYGIVVLGTYPILLYVPIQVLWGIIKARIAPSLATTITVLEDGVKQKRVVPARGYKLLAAELAFRASLVLITCKS